jgi:hypothetical protein
MPSDAFAYAQASVADGGRTVRASVLAASLNDQCIHQPEQATGDETPSTRLQVGDTQGYHVADTRATQCALR